MLDAELTVAHKKRYYSGAFSENFYPYFFKSYEYAIVATQSCKIDNRSAHVIELCAVKPLNRITSMLLSKNNQNQRHIVVYDNDLKTVRDNFRRLSDQQLDQFFFYPAQWDGNSIVGPPRVACIEIKIPIRVDVDHVDTNLSAILNSRLLSIAPVYRSKLSEKLARFYINVALEDTQTVFADEASFEDWIKSSLQDLYYLDPTKTLKPKVSAFIAKEFGSLSFSEIWDDPTNTGLMAKFIKVCQAEALAPKTS